MKNMINPIPPITIDDSIAPGIKPDTYEIYYNGKVMNKKTGRVMSTHPNHKGYPCVNLRMADGRNNSYLIHRLFMKAYHPIPNPDEFDIDHINCNVEDHRDCNLEWVTRKENARRAYINNLTVKGSDSRSAILNDDDVRFICERLELGIPLRIIADELKDRMGDRTCQYYYRIRNILLGEDWKHISKNYNFPDYHLPHRKSRKSSTTIESQFNSETGGDKIE